MAFNGRTRNDIALIRFSSKRQDRNGISISQALLTLPLLLLFLNTYSIILSSSPLFSRSYIFHIVHCCSNAEYSAIQTIMYYIISYGFDMNLSVWTWTIEKSFIYSYISLLFLHSNLFDFEFFFPRYLGVSWKSAQMIFFFSNSDHFGCSFEEVFWENRSLWMRFVH